MYLMSMAKSFFVSYRFEFVSEVSRDKGEEEKGAEGCRVSQARGNQTGALVGGANPREGRVKPREVRPIPQGP